MLQITINELLGQKRVGMQGKAVEGEISPQIIPQSLVDEMKLTFVSLEVAIAAALNHEYRVFLDQALEGRYLITKTLIDSGTIDQIFGGNWIGRLDSAGQIYYELLKRQSKVIPVGAKAVQVGGGGSAGGVTGVGGATMPPSPPPSPKVNWATLQKAVEAFDAPDKTVFIDVKSKCKYHIHSGNNAPERIEIEGDDGHWLNCTTVPRALANLLTRYRDSRLHLVERTGCADNFEPYSPPQVEGIPFPTDTSEDALKAKHVATADRETVFFSLLARKPAEGENGEAAFITLIDTLITDFHKPEWRIRRAGWARISTYLASSCIDR